MTLPSHSAASSQLPTAPPASQASATASLSPQTLPPELLPPGNISEAHAGGTALPPLWEQPPATAAEREALRAGWLRDLAAIVYGPIHKPPDRVAVERLLLPGERAEHLRITVEAGSRVARFDAALWLPSESDVAAPGAATDGPANAAAGAKPRRQVPLVLGLGFLGPAGVLEGDAFPLDPDATIHAPPELGVVDGRLAPHLRGVHASRWPLATILGQGFGLLLSGYGSWVPDRPDRMRQGGVWPLLGLQDNNDAPGAISLWAWSLARLVDAALALPEVDPSALHVAGFSRLGKAALWAAANDTRIAGVLAACAGCLGPKPSRRRFGETPLSMALRYPHWVSPRLAGHATDPRAWPVEQHQLLAAIAPRRLHLASAEGDLWADPLGERAGLIAALPAWDGQDPGVAHDAPLDRWRSLGTGPVGWHLRPGGHGILPFDWRQALRRLAA